VASPAEKPDSPLTIYVHSLRSWLHDAPYQAAIAVLAIAIGLICLWDGPALWHVLFTAAAAVAGAFVAHHEGKALGLTPNVYVEVAFVLEVGVVVAWATHRGFEGSQVMLGASLGSFGAYGTGAWARAMEATLPGAAVLWYSAGGALGLLIYTAWRQPVLAIFAPLLGGLFASSGIGLLLSRSFVLLGKLDNGHTAPGTTWLPASDSSWIDVVESMVGNGGGGVMLATLCACVLLGAVAQSVQGSRGCAVFLVGGGIAFSTLAASACQLAHVSTSIECPSWLSTDANWRWLVVGSMLWVSITVCAAYRQLGTRRDAMYVQLASGANNSKEPGKLLVVEPAHGMEDGNYLTMWAGRE